MLRTVDIFVYKRCKYPLFVACNTEEGGNGSATDGTYIGRGIKIDAIVEKLMTGPEAFTGKDPIDSFCGLWDTKL